MGDHIEIEGGVVRLLRHSGQGEAVLDREVSLHTFLQTLLATTGGFCRLPVLPIGTRFILGRGSDLLIAVEQPPPGSPLHLAAGRAAGSGPRLCIGLSLHSVPVALPRGVLRRDANLLPPCSADLGY